MKFTTRHLQRQHSNRPLRDLIFAPPHFKKEKKEKLPTLNFLSRFLSPASFSTFASRAFLFVEKNTNKSRTGFAKLAKELNPARKTKTRAKKFFLPARASWTALCLSTVLFFVDSFAQVNSEPLMPTFQQIPIGKSYDPANPFPDQWNYFPQLNNPLQTIREQQKMQTQQQNRQQMQKFGNEPQPTQEQMKVDYYDQLAIKRELKQKELFNTINTLDNDVRPIDPKKLEELEKAKKKLRLADTNSIDYKTYRKYYEKSYNEITQMLSGKTPLSLKRAVFLVENPFYKNKIGYEKYCKQIADLVFICKQIMQKEGLSPKNYMACHYTIQKLFSEKLTYKNSFGKEEVFEPFTYDLSIYDKARDNADWKEQHVTKLLDIKMGQCHSMPLLYLILAEELNANAYLALAPNHSYVKFGNQNQAYCFETTNGTFTSDEWIVSSGYISSSAIKNQIYLAPLGKKQVIAECLVDLENGFEFLCGKSDFSIKCANTTLSYFPNSIRSIIIINNMVVAECAKTASKYYFPKYDEYYKYPELKKQFDDMLDFELKVEEAGYQRISDEQYEKWRKSANEEKARREHLKLMTKLQESANEK